MAIYLGSNVSLQEKIKLGLNLEPPDLEEIFDEVEQLKSEVEQFAKSEELLSEQLSFARELLENIENDLHTCKSAKQAKEAFSKACDESFFER